MNVEAMWRPGRVRLWLSLVVPALAAVCGAVTARHHVLGFVLLGIAMVAAAWEMLDRARAAPRAIRLRDDRLHVDGAPFELRNAWVAPGWLVVRGRAGGRRERLAIYRGELTELEFCRLRRFCIRQLPRVNRPRFVRLRSNR